MQLSSGGHDLEMTAEAFGQLSDSNDLLGDVSALKTRISEDGYLLFRGLLNRDNVLDARRDIMLNFATIGEIDSINHPYMDGIQSSRSFIDKVNLIAFTESIRTGTAYTALVHDPALIGFFREFMNGEVRTFDFRWPRFMRPGECTGVHCDGPYITRGTKNVWSAWIPIGDVTMSEGALVILEGSHKNERLRSSYGTRDADREGLGWLSTDPVGLRKRLGGRWLSTDFKAGDVIVFGPYLVHASLDNNSAVGRCRLTSDTRYLLVGDELDERWNGDITNPHGGTQKVFLPGRGLGKNKEFTDEWKEVDELGRLLPSSAF
jgi:ectoine hydroxylase-related dioxygenase (phytanoyl-CoA dioxygenase family)